MEGFVSIDGRIVRAEEARVSVFDRGLLWGDGLFETMRVEQGRVHLFDRHVSRLRDGAMTLEIATPEADEIREAVRRTIEANGEARSIVRVTLTRGIARGGPASDTDGSMLMVAQRPLLQAIDSKARARLVTLRQRHLPPETPVRLKSLSYLGYVLAAREVARHGADEGVMLTADGIVAEGSITNIFIVSAGVVRTAPVSIGVLPGIARGRTLELARRLGHETREEPFSIGELRDADECFFTNAARGVIVVGSIDGHPLATEAAVAEALAAAYDAEMPDESIPAD